MNKRQAKKYRAKEIKKMIEIYGPEEVENMMLEAIRQIVILELRRKNNEQNDNRQCN